MKKDIYLYWYRHNVGCGNFGDELNPYIISHLTNKTIKNLPIPGTRNGRIIELLKKIILNKIIFKDIVSVLRSLRYKEYYIAVGSIIGRAKGKYCKVWGAGLMEKDENLENCNYFAVRGEITKKRIKEQGYNEPKAIGDPALLLPIIYQPKSKKKYYLGIIPHFVQISEISEISEINSNENILIINLLDDVETVIEKINSCENTISSSLHGLIVSHAYGIPSLWCELGKMQLLGDNVKFYDYFSSVHIPFYSKIKINTKGNVVAQSKILFNEYSKSTLINNDLGVIQKNLIKHSPFPIIDKYNI